MLALLVIYLIVVNSMNAFDFGLEASWGNRVGRMDGSSVFRGMI